MVYNDIFRQIPNVWPSSGAEPRESPSATLVPPHGWTCPPRYAPPMQTPDNANGAEPRETPSATLVPPHGWTCPTRYAPPSFRRSKISETQKRSDPRHGRGLCLLMCARDGGRPLPYPSRRRPRATDPQDHTEGTTEGRHAPAPSPSLLRPHDLEQGIETPYKAASSLHTTPREPSHDTAHPVNPSPRSAPT